MENKLLQTSRNEMTATCVRRYPVWYVQKPDQRRVMVVTRILRVKPKINFVFESSSEWYTQTKISS